MINRKAIDGVYTTLFIVGLVLGLGVAYAALKFIPGFNTLAMVCP